MWLSNFFFCTAREMQEVINKEVLKGRKRPIFSSRDKRMYSRTALKKGMSTASTRNGEDSCVFPDRCCIRRKAPGVRRT